MEDMEGRHFEPLIRSAEQILLQIEASRASAEDGVLAFDGDGTLWSGDVGEDVFHHAVERGMLQDAAGEALRAEARAFGLDPSGSPSELAKRLFAGYLEGVYPEREVCAMMAWCYAGFTLEQLGACIEDALSLRSLPTRKNRELTPVLDYARAKSLRVVVVSASPQHIVERAALEWGIRAEDVAASRPATSENRILPRLAAPVPYAEAKVSALSALVGRSRLLASFGDNVFDMDLLRAAELGVAVRPKPALRARLSELPGIVVLESN